MRPQFKSTFYIVEHNIQGRVILSEVSQPIADALKSKVRSTTIDKVQESLIQLA